MLPAEVFLSHSSADSAFTQQLTDVLRKSGVPVWYSATNILGAQQWHDEIGAALKRCDWFLIVLTKNAVESLWVKRELLFALQQTRLVNRIIPLLVEDCDYENLSWTLDSYQMVNFRDTFEAGCRGLLRIWGSGLQKL
jgi:hypothetical protein